jgi:hypothetical protein
MQRLPMYALFLEGTQRDTPVADLATIIEIIMLLPGRAAAGVRMEVCKLFVRYLGGDLSLVEDVQRMAHVQSFLREHAPDHPLRAFGEAIETVSPGALAKRETLELLELEVREGELRARLEASKAQLEQAHGQTKRSRIDTFVYCHEAVRRLGVEPDDRTRIQLRDMVQSVAIPTEALPRKEICVRAFLLSKKANVGLCEIKFGKAVATLKRESLQRAGLSEELPTKMTGRARTDAFIDKVCRDICALGVPQAEQAMRKPKGSDVLVAFGAADTSSGGFGYNSAPQHRLRHRLEHVHGCRVCLIDEYLTSQMCSSCEKKLVFVGINDRSEQASAEAQRRASGRRPPMYGVLKCLHCTSPNASEAKFPKRHWHRDVNAAVNIGRVYIHAAKNDGIGRPDYLMPPTK